MKRPLDRRRTLIRHRPITGVNLIVVFYIIAIILLSVEKVSFYTGMNTAEKATTIAVF